MEPMCIWPSASLVYETKSFVCLPLRVLLLLASLAAAQHTVSFWGHVGFFSSTLFLDFFFSDTDPRDMGKFFSPLSITELSQVLSLPTARPNPNMSLCASVRTISGDVKIYTFFLSLKVLKKVAFGAVIWKDGQLHVNKNSISVSTFSLFIRLLSLLVSSV